MSILPDHYIRELCNPPRRVPTDEGPNREPLITPFNEDQLQPASYDVRLSNEFIVIEPHDERYIDLNDPKITTKKVYAGKNGFVLHPGEFALGATYETISVPDNIVARIEGKSSLGRMGLIVHATAGFIDPGFHGRITLEMTNLLRVPIVLRPGKRIGHFSFQYTDSSVQKPYQGRYQGDTGVAPSRYGGDWSPVIFVPNEAGETLVDRLTTIVTPFDGEDAEETERIEEIQHIKAEDWLKLNSQDETLRSEAEHTIEFVAQAMTERCIGMARQMKREFRGTYCCIYLDHMTRNRYLRVVLVDKDKEL